MLFDLHAHTQAISKCCRLPAEKILETAKNNGIDGIVLTNHYQKNYITDGDADTFAKRYVDEFYCTEKLGEQMGIKVFFGIEVTAELYPKVHMLIYGVEPEFIKRHPLIFDCTQEEMYALVKDNGGVLIQAHPFRGGTTVLNTDFLDGIEVNCHPLYKNSFSKEILGIATENKLAVTCGGDFHADTYRPHCGMYIPKDVCSSKALGDYIKNASCLKLCIHEPNDAEYKDFDFHKIF